MQSHKLVGNTTKLDWPSAQIIESKKPDKNLDKRVQADPSKSAVL